MLLELSIEFSDAPDFLLELLALLGHFGLLKVHALAQFLERVTLLLEVPKLALKHLLVFLQERAELIELTVLEHLEATEGGGHLTGLRHLLHLLHGLGQQVVLALDQGLVVAQQQLQLLNRADF